MVLRRPKLRMALCCAFAILATAGCGLRELENRSKLLEKLVSTNAALAVVEGYVGRVPVYRKGTQSWQSFRAVHARCTDAVSHRLVKKMDTSQSVGFTSTMYMKTYIFLGCNDRIIDFEVDSQ